MKLYNEECRLPFNHNAIWYYIESEDDVGILNSIYNKLPHDDIKFKYKGYAEWVLVYTKPGLTKDIHVLYSEDQILEMLSKVG